MTLLHYYTNGYKKQISGSKLFLFVLALLRRFAVGGTVQRPCRDVENVILHVYANRAKRDITDSSSPRPLLNPASPALFIFFFF